MNTIIKYIISIFIGYLLGSSNMAYYIGKIKKVDIKNNGSGNYGTSNVVALIGKRAGTLVFIHDFLKSLIAVVIIGFLFPTAKYADMLAGCFAIVGHIFPFYLKFDGGKGFASYIGVGFALFPIPSLIALVVALLIALICDYMVVATCSFIVVIPLIAFLKGDTIATIILSLTSLLIVWKHKDNILNLVKKNGKEMKIKRALIKDYRINTKEIRNEEKSEK